MTSLLGAAPSPTPFLRVKHFAKGLKRDMRDRLMTPEAVFRLYLNRHGKGPYGYPNAPWHNAVLLTHQEVQNAVEQTRKLGLPALYYDDSKTWDSLAALDCIVKTTDHHARILDAGTELYSLVLPWLYLYGYRNLVGINLVFKRPFKRGPIRYEYGDITHTGFEENSFDAITCLSVIEHGVDTSAFFKEAARLLKPGGHLITSTDYYSEPIDTHGQQAYGVPIRIFTRGDILSLLEEAQGYGLTPTGEINLACQEKPVTWEEFQLDYTYAIFTLRKTGQESP